MSRLRPSVDEQLEEFALRIHDCLTEQLYERTNLEFWHELEALDVESNQGIYVAFEMAFAQMMDRYMFAPQVTTTLRAAKILMRSCVSVAMNNFYPHSVGPVPYIDRIIRNTMEIYYESIYVRLRTDMVMSNHSVHIIQRSFRKFFTDPSYKMCIRRLTREFETDQREFKAMLCSVK
jgi:hypothetical protein